MTKRSITIELDEQSVRDIEDALLMRAATANEFARDASSDAVEQSYHATAGRLNTLRMAIVNGYENPGAERISTSRLIPGDVITIDPTHPERRTGLAMVLSIDPDGTITVRQNDGKSVEMSGFTVAWRVLKSSSPVINSQTR